VTHSSPATLAALAAAIVVSVACGSQDPTSPSAAARPSTNGVLTIVSPRDGEMIRGGEVDLVVKLVGAKLSDMTTTDLVPDEGHLHVTLDDRLISMTSGLEETIPDVASGQHLLKVEFVANDHIPFEPRVIAQVAFEMKP
jgi:hypothetical protein